jgi:small subunit ribosomal protein S17e
LRRTSQDTWAPARKVNHGSNLGNTSLDRTRRLAQQILSRHPESFGTDYEKNKQALDELAVIPSKQLRNKIAGYIAKSAKMEEPENEEPSAEEEPEG